MGLSALQRAGCRSGCESQDGVVGELSAYSIVHIRKRTKVVSSKWQSMKWMAPEFKDNYLATTMCYVSLWYCGDSEIISGRCYTNKIMKSILIYGSLLYIIV